MPTIPGYPAAALPLDGTEIVPVWQGGEQRQAPSAVLKGAPGSPGEGYPARAEIAALAATSLDDVYLTEVGREGKFVFNAANLSAMVSADSNQGIYVAPSSDPTGSSGAWVRKFNGAYNIRWFGAKADNVTNDGPAFVAALTFLWGVSVHSGYGFNQNGCPKLYIPQGIYYLGTHTFDIVNTIIIEGDGSGYLGGPSTVLRWDDNTTGIRTQRNNTAGATGPSTVTTYGGSDGSVFKSLYLRGGYAGIESESHGLHMRAFCRCEDVFVDNFGGDGFHGSATIGDGTYEGNVSESSLYRCVAMNCRNGLFWDGADANASDIISGDFRYNRAWGSYDSSFLGNYYFACRTSTNGRITGATPTGCVYSGNRYYVKPGQAAGASINAPSGTTADNIYWGYIGAGSVGPGFVAWVSGTDFREGGSYKNDDPNSRSCYVGCYVESDQNWPQIAPPAVCIGGQAAQTNYGVGGCITTDTSGALQIGSTNRNPNANATFFECVTQQHQLQGRIWSDGGTSFTNVGSLTFLATVGNVYDVNNAAWLHWFKVNGTGVAQIDANGVQVWSGKIGYITGHGAGGTATQATSKSTGVTLNKSTGQITLNNASLAANTAVSFTFTNSQIAATDIVRVNVSGTATPGSYLVQAESAAAGSCVISVRNLTGGALAEAIVLNFAVIKGAND